MSEPTLSGDIAMKLEADNKEIWDAIHKLEEYYVCRGEHEELKDRVAAVEKQIAAIWAVLDVMHGFDNEPLPYEELD